MSVLKYLNSDRPYITVGMTWLLGPVHRLKLREREESLQLHQIQ